MHATLPVDSCPLLRKAAFSCVVIRSSKAPRARDAGHDQNHDGDQLGADLLSGERCRKQKSQNGLQELKFADARNAAVRQSPGSRQ